MNTTKVLFDVIHHNLTRADSALDYGRITDAIILLAEHIAENETAESDWYIGEFGEFTLSDLIVGAYWHYTEWHAGQNSKEYHALSSLGRVFSPGATSIESEFCEISPAITAYQILAEKAQA